METIDLAMKPHGMEMPMPSDVKMDKPYYPTVHLEGHEPFDLPPNGTVTFHFKEIAKEIRERDGAKHYSCTLELHAILDAEADSEHPEEDENKSDSKKTSDALDAHAEEYMKSNRKKESY